jgi:hypothetical protein
VAAPDYDEDDTVSADNEPLAPPPAIARARYSDVYQRGSYADRGYAPSAYGPPPAWQQTRRDWRDYPPPPPPRYGWYSPY